MFNKELFEISEKAFKSINQQDVQERFQKTEREVLGIIKAFANTLDENGIAHIRVPSRNYKSENPDYEVLRSIIDSGWQKYFEDEYSLYFVGDESIESYSDVYNEITFIWNSLEYNKRNMPKV